VKTRLFEQRLAAIEAMLVHLDAMVTRLSPPDCAGRLGTRDRRVAEIVLPILVTTLDGQPFLSSEAFAALASCPMRPENAKRIGRLLGRLERLGVIVAGCRVERYGFEGHQVLWRISPGVSGVFRDLQPA